MEEEIKIFLRAVLQLAKDAIVNEEIKADVAQYFHWQLDSFNYSSEGIADKSARGVYAEQKDWGRSIIKLMDKTRLLRRYSDFVSLLSNDHTQLRSPSMAVAQLVHHTLLKYLQKSESSEEDLIIAASDLFLKDVNGQPYTARAIGKLQGITLESSEFMLAPNIKLRIPAREDIEVPRMAWDFTGIGEDFHPLPSAILELEAMGLNVQDAQLQFALEKVAMILKLFSVGAVQFISYTMSNDSLLNKSGSGTLHRGSRHEAKLKYFITQREEHRLQQFYHSLSQLFPKDLVGFDKKINHLSIAFDRYNEALLFGVSIEWCITNIAMGLEAIFSNDNTELSYKLWVRISKLLSFLNEKPLEIADVIREVYKIRSKFAHGGHMDGKDRARVEKVFGSVKQLEEKALDCLRLAIIVFIVCKPVKETFISLIDCALIDKEKSNELNTFLSPVWGIFELET